MSGLKKKVNTDSVDETGYHRLCETDTVEITEYLVDFLVYNAIR
jgi:hypothetical protein